VQKSPSASRKPVELSALPAEWTACTEDSRPGRGEKGALLFGCCMAHLSLGGNHPSGPRVMLGAGGGCSTWGSQHSLSGPGSWWFLLPVRSVTHAASWVFVQKNRTGIRWRIMFKGLHCIIGMTCSQKI